MEGKGFDFGNAVKCGNITVRNTNLQSAKHDTGTMQPQIPAQRAEIKQSSRSARVYGMAPKLGISGPTVGRAFIKKWCGEPHISNADPHLVSLY